MNKEKLNKYENDEKFGFVVELENTLNKQNELIENLNKAIDELDKNKEKYFKLRDYYGSEKYFDDLAKEKNGYFPEDLPRGIFSEDAIYDLMGNQFNIGVKMVEKGIDIVKKY